MAFQTGSRCFLMSSRMESSHIQKLKGFPAMFSWGKEGRAHADTHPCSKPAPDGTSARAYLSKL